jgi:putative ATP-binding cassette transporter
VDGDTEASTALFRVLAGIWPWGRGEIAWPATTALCAIGVHPFMPEGRLRHTLAFPAGRACHVDALLRGAMARVGLTHLVPRLDESADWSRVLSAAELQRLAVARVLLHAPDWIVLGGAMDALEPAVADSMLKLLADVLPQAGLVVIGHYPGSSGMFSRRLHLQRAAGGVVLLQEIQARRQAALRPQGRPLRVVDWLRQGYGP